ncbi:4Fe-4S binding protein [Lagierella sp.]|uniref:4Fe-4S binding protein n=1 Tax=Lagierella sp. TaxID=2849657 RepID=UPI00262E367F|nr:4Fe-4S binding protein [Lagierella sp.]
MFNLFDFVDYKTQVDNSKCLYNKSTKSQCKRCVISCQEEAIEFKDGKIIVKDNCKNCNSCVNNCPVGALTGEKINFKYIKDTLIIDMEDFPDGFFSYIGFGYFSKWYLNGVKRIVHNIKEQNFIDRLMEFNSILEVNSLETIENVHTDKVVEYKKNDELINRKALLKNFATSILNGAKFIVGEKENVFQYFIILQRKLKTHISFFTVKINNSCKKCNACISLCPFKSLKMDGNIEQIDFCNNCKLCVDICPYKAIKIVKADIAFMISN